MHIHDEQEVPHLESEQQRPLPSWSNLCLGRSGSGPMRSKGYFLLT